MPAYCNNHDIFDWAPSWEDLMRDDHYDKEMEATYEGWPFSRIDTRALWDLSYATADDIEEYIAREKELRGND